MFVFFLAGVEGIVFYKNGKLVYPKANLTGTWKRSGGGYQLLTDGDKIQAYLSGNTLKLIPPKIFPFKNPIEYKRTSEASSNIDQKVKSMIRYNRKYYRTTKNKNGSQTYLIIENKTCSFITPNFKGLGSSKTSDSCSILNGQLYMGAFLGKAQILSSNKIKYGKNLYILRKNSSQQGLNLNHYLLGRWKNIHGKSKNISELDFTKKGSQLKVDVFFSCPPSICFWGKEKVTSIDKSGQKVELAYDNSFANSTKYLKIHLVGQKLTIETTTRFTDGSGRKNQIIHETFEKKLFITKSTKRALPLPLKKQQSRVTKLTPDQLRAKRLAEWYKAHPDKRPRK